MRRFSPSGSPKARAILIGLISLILLALLFPPPLSSRASPLYSPEDSAGLFPADTAFYITLNMRPGEEELSEIWDLLNGYWMERGDFSALWKELLSEAEEEGVNLEEEVFPWISEVGFGMWDLPSENPRMLLALEVDPLLQIKAFRFFEKLTEGAAFEEYKEIEIYELEGSSFAALLDSSWILFSNSPEAMKEAIDVTGGEISSLAGAEEFKKAQSEFPEGRFGMLWCDFDAFLELIKAEDEQTEAVFDLLEALVPEFGAGAVSAEEEAFRFDLWAPKPEGLPAPPSEPTPLNSAKLVPREVFAFGSSCSPNRMWEEVIKPFLEAHWDLLGELAGASEGEWPSSPEELLSAFEEEYGVNVEEILNLLQGEAASAFISLPETEEEMLSDLLLLFEIEGRDAFLSELESIISEAEPPLEIARGEIRGREVYFLKGPGVEENFKPSFFFAQAGGRDFVIFAFSRSSLLAAIHTAEDPSSSLGEADFFKNVISKLPEGFASFNYLEIARIFYSCARENEELKSRGLPFLAPLRAVAEADYITQEEARSTVYLLLHPPATVLSGRVVLEGRSDFSGAEVRVGEKSAKTSPSGFFELQDLPGGSAEVEISHPGFLRRDVQIELLSQARNYLPEIVLAAGDVNGDGAIDEGDLLEIGIDFGEEVEPGRASDLNGDGIVDIFDLVLGAKNFGRGGS